MMSQSATNERRRRATRPDFLRGIGSGWLVSFVLHGGLLWAAGAWVTHGAGNAGATVPDSDSPVRIDLGTTVASTRGAVRRDVAPEPPSIERHDVPVFRSEALVELDAADRELRTERVLALEAAGASIVGVSNAYAFLPEHAAAPPRANGDPSRLVPRALAAGTAAAGSSKGAGTAGTNPPRGTPAGGDGAASGHAGEGGLEEPPELADGPAPQYPATARRAGTEGDVRCRMSVDEDGIVRAVVVLRSSGSAVLDEAARTGLLAWRFRPARHGGAPCACRVDHVVKFRLVRVDSRR